MNRRVVQLPLRSAHKADRSISAPTALHAYHTHQRYRYPPPRSPSPACPPPRGRPTPLQTTLQRYRAAKMQSLAETTRGANEKLEEAKAMVLDTESGAGLRGRSVEDCPRDNAKRYVRAWAREAWRAERAERVAARRSSTDFQKVRGENVVRVPCGRLYRHGTVLKMVLRRRSCCRFCGFTKREVGRWWG